MKKVLEWDRRMLRGLVGTKRVVGNKAEHRFTKWFMMETKVKKD